MLVELIIPIDRLRGQLNKDGYYFRMYRGQQIVQRCPDRSGHVKTAAEAGNQRRFAETWGRGKRKRGNFNSALSRGAGNEMRMRLAGK